MFGQLLVWPICRLTSAEAPDLSEVVMAEYREKGSPTNKSDQDCEGLGCDNQYLKLSLVTNGQPVGHLQNVNNMSGTK